MLEAILTWSLRHRVAVLALWLGVVLLGVAALLRLPIDAFPDTTPVQVQVNTVAPALSPLEMERQVTAPVEQAIGGLPGLKEVRSISKFGLSQVTVTFEDGTDIYLARQVVSERLTAVELPRSIERPTLGPVATGLGEVFHYLVTPAVRGEASLAELRTAQDWIVRPQLRSVAGVAEINSWGGDERQVQVVVDPVRLQSFGLSLSRLVEVLEQGNLSVGGGALDEGGESSLVQGTGIVTTPEDLARTVVAAHAGVPVLVGDVARVVEGREIRQGAVTADGEGEVVLGLGFMLMGENSHDVTRRLSARLAEIRKTLPRGIEVSPVYQRTSLVDRVLATVRTNLLEGALLVVAVLFVFLGNLRAGLIVASAIPLSLLFAFDLMTRVGIAGSLMSLGAIDFGLVVDSSVIVVENTVRRLGLESENRPVLDVVRDAALEVRRPTLFGELIIIIVYLPILTLEGIEGKLFRPMALTVVFALAGSLLMSLTLTPVLASLALGRGVRHRETAVMRVLGRLYRPVLQGALAHRRLVLAGAGLLVLGGAFLATRLGSEFVPRLNEETIVINTVRLAGVAVDESVRYGTQIERALLAAFPQEIERVWTRTGSAEVATDPMGLELSDVFVTLTPRSTWKEARNQGELVARMEQALSGLPGMRLIFTQPIEMRVNEMIAGIRTDVGVKIFADDLDVLRAKAREVEAVVRGIRGAADVTSEQITGQPVIQVEVDREAAARYGISATEVLSVVGALGGTEVGELREGDRRFPIVVRLEDRYRLDAQALGGVLVTTAAGDRIPLAGLARIDTIKGPSTVNREWGKRRVVVQANVRGRDVGSFVAEAKEAIAREVSLPPGSWVRFGGQFEHLERARNRLLLVVPLALAGILFLLYLTYRRITDTLRVFTGVPFAAVGGVAALWLRDIPFSISAGVGFVALSGVAVLGDMVLVSTIRQLLAEGLERRTAIVAAAARRLRPVLMTGLVASLGFLPMAVNTGVGAEVQRPLATVVIGGILSSTLLTLVVLPVLYELLGRKAAPPGHRPLPPNRPLGDGPGSTYAMLGAARRRRRAPRGNKMRPSMLRLVPGTLVALALLQGPAVLARPEKTEAKGKQERAIRPAAPSGNRTEQVVDVAYERSDTVQAVRNAAGETVYSISASHFDVSPALRDLARTVRFEELLEKESAPENEQLPDFRKILSDQPDPVVQPVPQGGAFASVVTGFNFLGVGTNGLTPSDSNGSVGNDQFVETVNTRYQVWSLNRATSTATSLLGPVATNVLWSGFGGACQTQNAGDPIVIYDKLANRWLISQFTSTAASGVYYQCVALSTTPDATGTYFRWAFAVPNGHFGDYPHFGAWSDAYYMMAHAFSGGYVAAIFAAMDRTKMLAGDPAATWQVIEDPLEGGHMPADLDGFAPPPSGAPGVFLSWHTDGMYVYRMKVSFSSPSFTTLTLQAVVPVAPATGACGGGGSCIPQPGTTTRVGSLADRLMFRAAYRRFDDHETVVVSHSVDPGVTGLVSGVRWYDIRLSGPPSAACPDGYPCLHQQGTIADVVNGRSRWMSSIAMDGAENMLVGYSTTGKTAGVENHSLRYTGRAKNDPLGMVTVPEGTYATGTANNTNGRWGDYSSMSVDPFDDCTLWYVGQYFTTAGSWSTRVASVAFPAGTGDGQCAPTSCTSRPTIPAGIGSATVLGDNQVRVTWTGLGPQPGAYAVERAEGTCASPGYFQPLGHVAGNQTQFVDTTVQGGLTYAYRVRSATDADGRCQALNTSACTQVTATGACSLKPSFGGVESAASANDPGCGVRVTWTPGTSRCPLTPNLSYNVFRGTVPDFVPSAANRIATCAPGPDEFLDQANLSSGVTYYYVVRAEDDSTGHGGACSGGNEEANDRRVAGTAYGNGLQPGPGTWTDGGGDVTALLHLNVDEPGNTDDDTWRFVRAADDPGANHTPGGAYAYRNAGPGAAASTGANQCVEMQTPPLTVAAGTVTLQYWERHQLEYRWDGIALEYSVNGGNWFDVPLPSNDPGLGCAATDDITGFDTLGCTQSPPINACGYPTSKRVLTGPLLAGTSCTDWTTGAVTPYAHRCHPIPGFASGDTVRFRWRFTSDPGLHLAGFYLDDIAVTNVRLPNGCTPGNCGGQPDGNPCNDGNECTTGDACESGLCEGSPLPPPAETAGLSVDDSAGTTLTWTAGESGVVYDVAGATLDLLRAGGTASSACLLDDGAAASFLDSRPAPNPGDGYFYLVRAESVCGSGTWGFDSEAVERSLPAACP